MFNISQIYITDGDLDLPPLLNERVEIIKSFYSEDVHVLYKKDSLREFIKHNFDKDTIYAYDKLNHYSYKANLGRYCLLYIKGGWYFDISILLANKVAIKESTKAVIYRDMQFNDFNMFGSSNNYACSNSVIYSKKNNSILEKAIKKIIENCKKEYYGQNALSITSPGLFGKCIAEEELDNNYIFGDFIPLTPFYKKKNLAFITPDGIINAFFKDKTLEEFGAIGVNSYSELYNNKLVYKK